MCDALKELFAEELKEENEKGMERGIHLAKRTGTGDPGMTSRGD